MGKTIPKSIEVNSGSHLHIIWRRYNSSVYFMMLFSLIWMTFILSISFDDIKHGRLLEIFPIPGIHLFLGIYFIFYSVATLLNKIEIKLDNNLIYVTDLNIPLGNNRKLDLKSVKQFVSVKQTYIYRRKPTFQVNCIFNDEKRKNLLFGLYTREESDYIVSQLNTYLGLKDDNGEDDSYMSLDTPREFIPLLMAFLIFLLFIFLMKMF